MSDEEHLTYIDVSKKVSTQRSKLVPPPILTTSLIGTNKKVQRARSCRPLLVLSRMGSSEERRGLGDGIMSSILFPGGTRLCFLVSSI